MALAPYHRASTTTLIHARALGDIRRISVTWQVGELDTSTFRVHGQPVVPGHDTGLRPTPHNLIGDVDHPHFVHDGLSAAAETWEYLVLAIDPEGDLRGVSDPVRATSRTSVTVTGQPIATVGSFDGRGLELALSPSGYVHYQSMFPADVDFTHGRDRADRSWSYLQPGPDDAWAGRRGHRFRLRFEMSQVPAYDLDLALWLTDRHPVRAGAAGLYINGIRQEPLIFADDTEHAGDRPGGDVPGHGAGPAYLERSMARTLFVPGENVLEIVKDQGSWIAYDALGVFARPA